MKTRFSKKSVGEWARKRRNDLEMEYKFDPSNGYAQVEGDSQERILAYGQYDELGDLIEEFGL